MARDIGNKMKRAEVWAKEKAAKAKAKAKKKEERAKKRTRQQDLLRDGGEIGELEEPAKKQRTLENTREVETTAVYAGDKEVAGDEADDEFACHEYRPDCDGEPWEGFVKPKVMITTRPRPSKELFKFIGDLISVIPNAYFYPRRDFRVQQICQFASNKRFTHLFVLSEKSKKCNGLIVSKLPRGPTAFFKVSNVECGASIENVGRQTSHQPEILLNNFTTRLGRRVGRLLGSLFYAKPNFQGRQAVTFHNQRDYVFVRHHRYIFEERDDKQQQQQQEAAKKQPPKRVIARLQELGPRFTLRLRWLQEGTFDTQFGEYEWFHRRKQMDTSRRKFHL